MKRTRPLAIVVSAPSGAGKSTLCNRLTTEFPARVVYSVSCTTRPARGEERDGREYYFLSTKEFRRRIGNGEFLEWAKVHGNYYGTLEDTVSYALEEGKHVLLDIDVQGAEQIRAALRRMPEEHLIRRGFLDVFVLPPSEEELERRLRGRGTDDEATIRKRLKNATKEMAAAAKYAHRIVNDDLNRAYAELRALVLEAERA